MSLAAFFHWLQSMEFATAIRESALVYPIIMASHLTGMALFGGMILMVDMRLLGLAMTSYSVTDVVGQLRIWKRIGFVMVVTCGVLLAWSEGDKYYPNPFFWTKMTLLALVGIHALVFRRSVYANTEEIDRAPKIPGRAKLAAGLSLLLWASLVCAGRWIGYWEAPRKPDIAIVK
jgi:uncharacterized membrane protein